MVQILSKIFLIKRYFVPEVGVSLTENTKNKNGGKDFSSFFGKPSKYDYSNISNQNLKKTQNLMNTSNFVSLTEPSEKPKIERINNSKITNNFGNSAELSLPLVNNRNLKSSLPNYPSNTKIFDSLRISTKLTGTLKMALDSLDLIPEYNENHYEIYNIDIFKRRKNYLEEKKDSDKKLISSSLDQINKFNYSIMRNKGWGQSAMERLKLEEPKEYFKPDRKELEHELGQKIVNTKLPRSRIISSLNKIK